MILKMNTIIEWDCVKKNCLLKQSCDKKNRLCKRKICHINIEDQNWIKTEQTHLILNKRSVKLLMQILWLRKYAGMLICVKIHKTHLKNAQDSTRKNSSRIKWERRACHLMTDRKLYSFGLYLIHTSKSVWWYRSGMRLCEEIAKDYRHPRIISRYISRDKELDPRDLDAEMGSWVNGENRDAYQFMWAKLFKGRCVLKLRQKVVWGGV